MRRVLVTGGAGFIGSHLVDALLAQGDQVRILDNLTPQVHGPAGQWPAYLSRDAELVVGDIRDRATVRRCLEGVTAISHQASAVGVGQSMYEIARYTEVNVGGTAVLLDVLANDKHNVERLVVASSMSIYGEGRYSCAVHGPQDAALRPAGQLAVHDWEMHCPHPQCARGLAALPTTEEKPLRPTSVYAVNKRDQEEMCLCVGRAYGIPTLALRYFNTYGPRQALSNPYTGAVAIFSSRLLNGKPPVIYEDGRQSRDFTHVHDIVAANVRALAPNAPGDLALNVGTGVATTLVELVAALNSALGTQIEPRIEQKFRVGDIRHCYAGISAARDALGYKPSMTLQEGLAGLVGWLRNERSSDIFDQAHRELTAKGLAM